jgi:hypothetical protein
MSASSPRRAASGAIVAAILPTRTTGTVVAVGDDAGERDASPPSEHPAIDRSAATPTTIDNRTATARTRSVCRALYRTGGQDRLRLLAERAVRDLGRQDGHDRSSAQPGHLRCF